MKNEIVLEEIRDGRLKGTEVALRAEKTTISEALQSAFQKLRDAREHLGKLVTLLQGKDD